MPYTLTMGLLWFALALVIGFVIGWLLRSIRATRQVRATRHARHDAAEIERLRAELAALTAGAGADATLPDDARDTGVEAAIDGRVPADTVPDTLADPTVPPPVDEPGDDLTAVPGITPELAARCRAIGITTWAELADTEVSLLRTMLADAGPDYAGAEPDGWPEAAARLARGDA